MHFPWCHGRSRRPSVQVGVAIPLESLVEIGFGVACLVGFVLLVGRRDVVVVVVVPDARVVVVVAVAAVVVVVMVVLVVEE